MKQGGGSTFLSRKSWKRRWFLLQGNQLTYHKSNLYIISHMPSEVSLALSRLGSAFMPHKLLNLKVVETERKPMLCCLLVQLIFQLCIMLRACRFARMPLACSI